jgi:molybdate transport system substrate-binding protein
VNAAIRFRRGLRLAAAAIGLTVVLAGARPAGADELTLSVAISLKDVIEELGRRFAHARPGVALHSNFGASGDLQKQIEAGAPVDVFISAATSQMDQLERRGLVLAASRRAFAKNALTVVTPPDSNVDLTRAEDLLDDRVRRIVIGNPRTVPAGQYAEESLRALGLWDRLQSRLVFAENVRQALDYVARGEVDAGWVYVTDALSRRGRVNEAFRPPEDTYRPVIYPAAVVKDTKHAALAQAFVALLTSDDGRAALRRFGFQTPPAGAR